MTDEDNAVDRGPVDDGSAMGAVHYQSSASARDDEMADAISMDDVGDHGPADSPYGETTRLPQLPQQPGMAAESSRDRAMNPPAGTPAAGPDLPPPYVTETEQPATGRRARRKKLEELTGRRRKAPWWELPLLVIIAIVIAVLVKTFVVQPFYIPSQSMEKTLHGCPGCKGDRILVNKPIYHLRDPHPGDIVVFDAPPGWDDEIAPTPPSNPVLKAIRGFGQLVGFVPPDGLVLVKRVIAIGGQTVKGDAAGHVMVSDNGTAGPWRTLDEHTYTYESGSDSHAAFGPVTVPKGRLWVMGDHRNDSADSRFHCGVGGTETGDDVVCDPTTSTVPVKDVIGKAVLIAWPPSRWRTLGTPATFKHSAEALDAAGTALPAAGSALVLVPVYLVRRRRRRP